MCALKKEKIMTDWKKLYVFLGDWGTICLETTDSDLHIHKNDLKKTKSLYPQKQEAKNSQHSCDKIIIVLRVIMEEETV